MSALPPPYDPHNDQFVRALTCPHPGCGAPAPVVADDDDVLCVCAACDRPFEVVLAAVGEGAGAFPLPVARRAHTMSCTTTGQPLERARVIDWAGAGGSPSRAGTLADRRGLVFGEPTRDVEWDLAAGWSQGAWGLKDPAREGPSADSAETVTSVSVFRGAVVVVTALGRVGLFDCEDGRPLLDHPLTWPGVDIDDDDHARAVRLPPAFIGTTMVVTTDRIALVRDLSTSLFPLARRKTPGLFVELAPGAGRQFLGPALACSSASGPRIVLAVCPSAGRVSALDDAEVRVLDVIGTEIARVPAPGIARPPVWDAQSNRVVWVNALGHLSSFSPDAPRNVATTLPGEMLELGRGERPHLVVAPDNAGSAEAWLADDGGGTVRVWRTSLLRALRDGDWSWEPMFEHKDAGALRGMSVGLGSGDRRNVASQHLVLSTERATSALSRALKGTASDAILSRAPIAPPILTSVGFLTQDRKGLWLRAMPPWSFKDKNPERFLEPGVVEARPAFFDRTFAIHGRQVFYAHGGRVHEARLRSRRATHEANDG